ncbi:NAD(P)/FAD-dependent oxidoreductase [Thermodesulfovibrio yellowstonii]|uniref:Thioredoxin reductase n=1 Tax=Thermodesulfovibrio yellowstonii TaxID=28262 RepID=A0A9W6GFF6_9BACT|nr:FAD-dependent oxidoreductase [Thermodesulfovibrio islandicus]GLI52882.1 thioredoxin reductase [Thermodesulfovibrio islandicus]
MSEIYDVVIVGGGPAGLTAGVYAARANLKTLILDKSKTAGALAYASLIENYPGMERPLTGKELLERIRAQALSFGVEYREEQVVGVDLVSETKEVITMSGSYKGKTVIIATGSMGRKPTIKGEGELLGRGVSYCAVCDAPFFRGKTVAVIGDSEEAVKEAVYLTEFTELCYLVTSSSKLKVEESHPVFTNSKIKILTGYTIKEIVGTDFVTGLKISKEGVEQTLEVNGVFVFIQGSQPITDFLGETLKVDERGFIVVDNFMQTSIPGVFAAGDVASPHVRQVVIACAQGAVAALSAEKYIRGRSRIKADWHG